MSKNWSKHLEPVRNWLAQQLSEAVLRDDHAAMRAISDAVVLISRLSTKLTSLADGTTMDTEPVNLPPDPEEEVKEEYPKFRLESRRLVMTGPSHDGKKKEYEHAVTRQRYDQIVACLCSLAAVRSDFTSDTVMKKVGGPDHHTRAVLKFLVKKKLVASESKGHYSFSPRFNEGVNDAWPEAAN